MPMRPVRIDWTGVMWGLLLLLPGGLYWLKRLPVSVEWLHPALTIALAMGALVCFFLGGFRPSRHERWYLCPLKNGCYLLLLTQIFYGSLAKPAFHLCVFALCLLCLISAIGSLQTYGSRLLTISLAVVYLLMTTDATINLTEFGLFYDSQIYCCPPFAQTFLAGFLFLAGIFELEIALLYGNRSKTPRAPEERKDCKPAQNG